jgi:hypothetical protein
MEYLAFPEERPNKFLLWAGVLASAEVGLRLRRVFRTLRKKHFDPVNPVNRIFFGKETL